MIIGTSMLEIAYYSQTPPNGTPLNGNPAQLEQNPISHGCTVEISIEN